MTERVAIVGYGAIGQALAAGLLRENRTNLVGVLVRTRQLEEARASLPATVRVAATLDEILAAGPALVVECAGQGAIRECGMAVLSAGVDLMVVSTGALAMPDLLDAFREAAEGAGSRILVPAGAIAGLDGLGALRQAGLTSVTYTSTKPPLAWRGTPAEEWIDLASLREPATVFEGSAREAALRFPKNANLAATVALAGLGLDDTLVRLVADPGLDGSTGTVEATSAVGDMKVIMSGLASANPKTSASTVYSLLHAVRSRAATLVI